MKLADATPLSPEELEIERLRAKLDEAADLVQHRFPGAASMAHWIRGAKFEPAREPESFRATAASYGLLKALRALVETREKYEACCATHTRSVDTTRAAYTAWQDAQSAARRLLAGRPPADPGGPATVAALQEVAGCGALTSRTRDWAAGTLGRLK